MPTIFVLAVTGVLKDEGYVDKEVKMMPRRDGTGPVGAGRMTGRGQGLCTGFAAPVYGKPGEVGYGFGGGHGCRRMFHASVVPGRARFGYPVYTGANEKPTGEREILSNQAEYLERQLQQVKKRLSRLLDDEE